MVVLIIASMGLAVAIAVAFIAARAHSLTASVITNDDHFKKLDVDVVKFT